MRHFKIVDSEGFIVAIGSTLDETQYGLTINSSEYNRLFNQINEKPVKLGYEFKLDSASQEWISFEVLKQNLTNEELKEFYSEEILNSIEIQQYPSIIKEGYKAIQVFNPSCHAIMWELVPIQSDNTPIETNTGSYTDPIQWTPGMNIVAGVNEDYVSDGWYVYEDLVQRCIQSGQPESFTDELYWEVI